MIRGPRLTIASMLVIVGLLAVGMAALFSSARFWISVAAPSTLAMLLGAVVGVIRFALVLHLDRMDAFGFSNLAVRLPN